MQFRKSLWLKASLMRILYPKHMSGALNFVWNFIAEGKELEPFQMIATLARTYLCLLSITGPICCRKLLYSLFLEAHFLTLHPMIYRI